MYACLDVNICVETVQSRKLEHIHVNVSMRDEKKERSKLARSNKEEGKATTNVHERKNKAKLNSAV